VGVQKKSEKLLKQQQQQIKTKEKRLAYTKLDENEKKELRKQRKEKQAQNKQNRLEKQRNREKDKMLKAQEKEKKLWEEVQPTKDQENEIKHESDVNVRIKILLKIKKRKKIQPTSNDNPKKKRKAIKAKRKGFLYTQSIRTLNEVVKDVREIDCNLEIEDFEQPYVRKLRLNLTTEQKKLLHQWLGGCRRIYNELVAMDNNDGWQPIFGVSNPSMTEKRKFLLKDKLIDQWMLNIPVRSCFIFSFKYLYLIHIFVVVFSTTYAS